MVVYTVSQVSAHIKESLESDPSLMDLWIIGEVSGLRASSAGHTYFSLKDREGGCDVIIVGRGGGSMEDLWPFNEEVVARAIYACKTPVVSAVGHETDETIADYVADVRAPTPSAAAELVVPDAFVLRRNLESVAAMFHRVLMDQTARGRSEVTVVRRRMEISLPDTQTLRRRVDDVERVVQAASSRLLLESKMKVDGLSQRLRALDPLATLGRGFSIVHLPDTGQVVSSTKQVSEGDALEITVTDGSLPAVVGLQDFVPSALGKAKSTVAKRKTKAKIAQQRGMTPLF